MRIRQNPLSSFTRYLSIRDQQISGSVARLSSGVRLNSAGDDTASFSVSARMRGLSRSTRMAMRNIQSGLDLLATADGSLQEISRLLQRGRELAVMASNGIWQPEQRASLHEELSRIRETIDQIASHAVYNGRPLFGRMPDPTRMVRDDSFDAASGIAAMSGLTLGSGTLGLTSTSTSLFTDTFANLLNVDPLSTATWDALSQSFQAAQSPALTFQDSFDNTSLINLGQTSAVISTGSGLVTVGATVPTWQTLASSDLSSLTGIDPSSTVTLDTTAGQAYLGQNWFTLGSDSYAAGSGQLTSSPVTYTLGSDSFTDASNVSASSGVLVGGGTVTLTSGLTGVVASENLAGTGVLTPSDTYNAKVLGAQAGGAVLAGPGGNNPWNAEGIVTSDVIYDAATSTYKLWFSTKRQVGAMNPALGYATSTDGVTWSAPVQASLGGGTGNLQSQGPISVYQEGGTYYLLYKGGADRVAYRTSADGLTWSNEQVLAAVTGISDRATVVKDDAGLYHMFVGTTGGIDQYTANSITGAWTRVSGFSLAGTQPEIAKELDAQGNTLYSIYYKSSAAAGSIIKASSTDLLTWSAPTTVLTTNDTSGVTFDDTNIRVGGVVTDPTTGLSRMLYTGSTATKYSLGLAYVKANDTGTYQSQVYTTASSITTFQFDATATTPAGTGITYEVSGDGGSTWTTVTPGGTFTLGTPGNQLVMRASLTNSNPAANPTATPELLSWSSNPIGYSGPGEVVSQPWSLGGDMIDNITLNPTGSTPAGTGIQYYVSTDGATWQAITAGVNTALDTPGTNVYVRSVLSTSDLNATPVLSGYSLTTGANEYASSQQIVTQDWNFAGSVDQIRLNVTDTQPAGTGIAYEISTDGGSTWLAVTPGSQLSLGTPTSSLKMRATLTTTDPSVTPELLNYSLEGLRYQSSQQLTTQNYTFAGAVDTLRLEQTATLPAGTGIDWAYSLNNGATWVNFTPGTDVGLGTTTTQVKLRATFTGTDTETPILDQFTLTGLTPATSGTRTLTTSVYDAGQTVQAIQLTVSENKPVGTDITYEISADGGTNWQAIAPGSLVNLSTPGAQLVLRANLTGNGAAVPELLDYRLDVPAATISGSMVQSTVQSLAAPVSNLKLNTTSVTPAGTSIQYQVSTNGGSTWQSIQPGQLTQLATPGDQLVLRAVLGSTSAVLTPELLDWSLETSAFATTGEMTSTVQSLEQAGTRFRLETDHSLLAGGTGLEYELSNDGGLTWLAAAPGDTVTFATAGTQLTVRARWTSPTGTDTPVLRGYRIYQLSEQSAPTENGIRIQEGPALTDTLLINLPAMSAAALGLEETSLETQTGATEAIQALDRAIDKTSSLLSTVGAASQRLERALSHRQVMYENMETTISRIQDTDMAREILAFTREQLLLQGGMAGLSLGMDLRRDTIGALLKPLDFLEA